VVFQPKTGSGGRLVEAIEELRGLVKAVEGHPLVLFVTPCFGVIHWFFNDFIATWVFENVLETGYRILRLGLGLG
jgi:hypothetical protein